MSRNDARRQATEQAIVDAATRLFSRDGYARTTFAAIAKEADVSERIVYVRFPTKVRLFQRVIEAATVGDLDSTPLPGRDWSTLAFTAPSLNDRIVAFAKGVSIMHERLGPLMSVNGEVEPLEPEVRVSASLARQATVDFLRTFWSSARADGLLDEGADIEWLVSVGTVLSAAESRLLITRSFEWDRVRYRDWLIESWTRLASVG